MDNKERDFFKKVIQECIEGGDFDPDAPVDSFRAARGRFLQAGKKRGDFGDMLKVFLDILEELGKTVNEDHALIKRAREGKIGQTRSKQGSERKSIITSQMQREAWGVGRRDEALMRD